jgi:hypothetical protein
LEALPAMKAMSPLAWQCQRVLYDISTYHCVGLFWIPGHSGYVEMKSPMSSQGRALLTTLLDRSWPWWSQGSVWEEKFSAGWIDSTWYDGGDWLVGTLRQAQELILGPRIAAKTTLMSFNRAQSRVVIGLLTGHNTLRRHLHIMGLMDSPLCRKCGAGGETLAHVLCECEALATGISIWDPFSCTLRMLEVWV